LAIDSLLTESNPVELCPIVRAVWAGTEIVETASLLVVP